MDLTFLFPFQSLQQTYLAAGGFNGFGNIKTTEILVEGDTAWVITEPLPLARNGLRATTVNNVIYLLGMEVWQLEEKYLP